VLKLIFIAFAVKSTFADSAEKVEVSDTTMFNSSTNACQKKKY
jgi:hypothetical protein